MTTLVKLQSQDNKTYEISRDIAERSKLLKNLLGDTEDETSEIPLPNINSRVLQEIINYWNDPESDRDTFYADMSKDDLFEVILGVNYLDDKEFLDYLCKKAADRIRGKSVEEIKKFFE